MATTKSPEPGYPYTALPPGTIRLLRLYAGTYLMCDLIIAHLDNIPPYEALSYCWGDSASRKPITCNGIRGLSITENLHSALSHLLLPHQPRLVWADAICINQEDVEERGAQVRLMKEIYRRATSVVVWLGEGVEVDGKKDVWPIPSLLEAAQKGLRRNQLPIRHGTKDWVRYVLRPDYTTAGDLDDKRWNATIKSLILLLHRPWFLRTWIIQEVALAARAVVMCGSHVARWEDFYTSVSYAIDLDYFSSTQPEMYSSIQNIEHVRRGLARDHYSRPLDLLASFKIFLATDPRDKVFGLYSLISASDLAVLELQPDYTIDVFKVFSQATLDCIATEGNLDVLSFGGQDCRIENSQLPTWVPDWSLPDRTIPLSPRFLSTLSFDADQWPCTWSSVTGKSYPVVELTENPKTIKIAGYVFDEITELGGVLDKQYFESQPSNAGFEMSNIFGKGSEIYNKWEVICSVPTNATYCTGEAAWDVYWKTLHGGFYPYGDEARTKEAFERWYQPFRNLRSFTDYTGNRLDEIDKKEAGSAYKIAAGAGWLAKVMYKSAKFGMQTMLTANKLPPSKILAFHRTMFKTKKGYVGITSRHAKVGSSVAFFQGGKLPLILNERENGQWGIVGDAYIHGIMGGDKFASAECKMMCVC
ncbi:HET-domain-containing protein [Cadophora sp. DSE1049]|nr:HET-domain-containing protein [Cadophora sp. DSE1049]